MHATRRQFLVSSAALCLTNSIPALGQEKLRVRPIPGTDENLPVIGLGNSSAFRDGDLQLSREIISSFVENGGAYIDCMGPSRFVVADTVKELDAARDAFLGTYFMNPDEAAMRVSAKRILDTTGKPALDLLHAYPEYAVPNWDRLRRWKEEGLTRYIGVSRHQPRYYGAMMKLMKTGTVDFIQVNYSPLETKADKRILPMAADLGVAVNINRPFINGRYFSLVGGRELPSWVAEFDCESWAQLSLKFILSHPAVNCVLTETADPAHAIDNIRAGMGRLPDTAMRERIRKLLQGLA